MIKYLGSKRTLLPAICSVVEALPEVRSCIDLFSGTSRVGHALKGKGFQVFSNDLNGRRRPQRLLLIVIKSSQKKAILQRLFAKKHDSFSQKMEQKLMRFESGLKHRILNPN